MSRREDRRILIAEDDFTSRELLRAMLVKRGFDLLCADNGRAALDHLQDEHAPSLVILDWIMPEMDGTEVCRQIRANEDGAQSTYVIMLTSCKELHEMEEAMDSGADDLMTKPFETHVLLQRIELGFRFIELLRENQRLQATSPID